VRLEVGMTCRRYERRPLLAALAGSVGPSEHVDLQVAAALVDVALRDPCGRRLAKASSRSPRESAEPRAASGSRPGAEPRSRRPTRDGARRADRHGPARTWVQSLGRARRQPVSTCAATEVGRKLQA
jgi:hypothetical protein